MSKAEIAEVWAAAGTLRYPWGPFYRLALLTLQRRSEVGEMRWPELSDDLSVWDLSVKAGKPHNVHLAEAARAILRELPRFDGCDFVLTNDGKNPITPGTKHKTMLMDAIEQLRREAPANSGGARESKPWTVHDFRRTDRALLNRDDSRAFPFLELLINAFSRPADQFSEYALGYFHPEARCGWLARFVMCEAEQEHWQCGSQDRETRNPRPAHWSVAVGRIEQPSAPG